MFGKAMKKGDMWVSVLQFKPDLLSQSTRYELTMLESQIVVFVFGLVCWSIC
jgi:hypothetical protein